MRYRLLGGSGLRVSGLCLGTMGFLSSSGWGTGREESRRVFEAFLEAGGNFVDTANTYGDGESEEFLGEFIAGRRHQVVVGTKYGGRFLGSPGPPDPNASGSHRKSLERAVDGSLRRLGVDYIDVLWVQAWDFLTPVDELMRALDDLVRRGKVLHLGVSNAPAWVVAQANTRASLRGWTPFAALQAEYNLTERDAERELLPMAAALDVSLLAWTPLASGWLTGKYEEEDGGAPRRLDDPVMGRFVDRGERNRRIAAEVVAVARERGCPPSQVALNWLRSRGAIPVFGARTPEQVRENA
ncbi:MAG TPA: aldo/keto reductase, partial [Longimicrobium sp.]